MSEVDTLYIEGYMGLELSIKTDLSYQHIDANWSHGMNETTRYVEGETRHSAEV